MHGIHHVVNRVAHKSGYTIDDDLWDRPPTQRNYRGTCCHRLDHHQTERLGPVTGKQRRCTGSVECRLGRFLQLTDECEVIVVEEWIDLRAVVVDVERIDLRS